MIKIATWNVNSIRTRLNHLLQWLNENQPDIIAIQEIKTIDEKFPYAEIEAAGYQVTYYGQKSYNGVAIISKEKLNHIVKNIPCFPDTQARVIAGSYRDLRVINLYIPNGQSLDSDKFQYKLQWLKAMHTYLADELKKYPAIIVLGDFNIAPTDIDVHDPAVWQGQVLVSPAERQAFTALLELGFKDSFRLFQQEGGFYSWWDYRAAAFRRNLGLRIDHILVSETLVPMCTTCYIDRIPRTWEQPSDHTIVVAELNDSQKKD